MSIWSRILAELHDTSGQGPPPTFDSVRRRYLLALHRHSGRDVILYAAGWLQKDGSLPASASINDEDVQAFMEVCQELETDGLDLIMHSPGGSPEATEAIVSYLRSRFSDIRVIVPQLAMSGATMIACAADRIVLGSQSSLGPIDPQLVVPTSLGTRTVSAQAVLDQFDRAQRECTDPAKLSAWLPMLAQYGPDLLEQCEAALDMSRDLVRRWLESYMFRDMDDGPERAQSVCDWLARRENFKSHARHIPRGEIEQRRMVVSRLEDDPAFQDLVLSVFHATTHTFTGTSAIKIVENHAGRAFIKQQVTQTVQAGPDRKSPDG